MISHKVIHVKVHDYFQLRSYYVSVPKGNTIGKSRIMNYGLSITDSKYFLILDSDNQPKSVTVTQVVEQVHSEKNFYDAVGVVKTINATTNMRFA